MKKSSMIFVVLLAITGFVQAQQYTFNGLDMSMGNLSRLSNAKTRSISPENFTGEPGETITIAEIEGPGAIQQIRMTPIGNWRFSILRMYWDDEKEPSVECPVGDFFASAYNEYAQLSSLAICVNPGSAFNYY